MISWGLEWHTLDTYMQWTEIASAPPTPESNQIKQYAFDSSGISTMCWKNDAGNVICLPTSGTLVTGTGVANQVAIWSGTSTLIGDTGLTFDPTTNALVVSGSITDSGLTATRVVFVGTAGLLTDSVNFRLLNPTGATQLLIDGTPNSIISIDGDATGNPFIEWLQNAVSKANIQYVNSDASLRIANQGIVSQVISSTGNIGFGTNTTPNYAGFTRAVTIESAANVAYEGASTRADADDAGIAFFEGNYRTNSVNHQRIANIQFLSSGTTANQRGGQIRFHTKADANITLTERFRIGPSGQWGIGGATFGTAGQVFTSGGAAAAPTWTTPTAGTVTGTGVSGRVAFWDGASSLSSDADFTFSVDTLSIDNITLPSLGSSTEGVIRAGTARLLHTFGTTNNTFLGEDSGNFTLSGANFNTGLGALTLQALTTGDSNTAIGRRALIGVTTGSDNIGLGVNAGSTITTGSKNISIGPAAMSASTTADEGIAIGFEAARDRTSGTVPVAIGVQALAALTTGSRNTAIGAIALAGLTTGSECTAVGRAALNATTGDNNTGIGHNAGLSITSGSDNVMIGGSADVSTGTLTNAVAIGRSTVVGSSDYIMLGVAAHSVGIAGAAKPTTGTGGLIFPDGTALSTMATNTAGLYANDVAGTVEMFAIDEVGNSTQISSHNFTLFQPDQSYLFPWSFYAKNPYIGKEINIDMWRLVAAVERISQAQILYTRDLPTNEIRNWDADQQANVTRRQQEIATWDSSSDENKSNHPRPAPIVAKPAPAWMKPLLKQGSLL